MNKDLEVRDASADLTPMHGPMPYAYSGGGDSGVPAWMEADPPYGPTDGVIDTIARYWSYVIRWPRKLAIGFLWITYTPWRSIYLFGTIFLVYVALTSSFEMTESPTNTKIVQVHPEPTSTDNP